MNSLGSLIFFVSKTLASALPWQMGSFDNERFLLETMIKTITDSEYHFRCNCSKSIINEKLRNIIVVDCGNNFQILELDVKNRVVGKEIIINQGSSKKLAGDISKQIRKFFHTKKISLYFCFLDKKEDEKLQKEVYDACKDLLGLIVTCDEVCLDYKKCLAINIDLTESKFCDCFKKHLFEDVLPKLKSKMTNDLLLKPRSFKRFLHNAIKKSRNQYLESEQHNEAQKFFVDFNIKFADTKFFWNLLKYLFTDREFGPYFIFFLNTSMCRDHLTTNTTIEQMCSLIKNGKYEDLKEEDRKEWKRFACNSLFELIFEVKHPRRYELIDKLISFDLIKEKGELLSKIKANIRKRFNFNLEILKMILDDKSNQSIRSELYKSRMVFDEECYENFTKAIRSIFLKRSDNLSFTITLDLK